MDKAGNVSKGSKVTTVFSSKTSYAVPKPAVRSKA